MTTMKDHAHNEKQKRAMYEIMVKQNMNVEGLNDQILADVTEIFIGIMQRVDNEAKTPKEREQFLMSAIIFTLFKALQSKYEDKED